MISPREIINEAAIRVNLCPRKQALDGGKLESGFKLLQGIIAKYNNDNLLAWTQDYVRVPNGQFIHIHDEEVTVEDPSMVDVPLKDCAKINAVYVESDSKLLHGKLEYVAPADFDRYGSNARVYTVTQKAESEWVIEIKPYVARMNNYKLKIHYNRGLQFDLDDELYIPDNYIELLIVAVAHKLALQYPRLDDAQMTRLENEVRVLVDNVRTPKAADRIIQRDDYFTYGHTMTQAELESGSWL